MDERVKGTSHQNPHYTPKETLLSKPKKKGSRNGEKQEDRYESPSESDENSYAKDPRLKSSILKKINTPKSPLEDKLP